MTCAAGIFPMPWKSWTASSPNGTASAPPNVVQPRTSRSIRCGAAIAISCAIIPPIDTPITRAREIPSRSSTPSASFASCAIAYGPGGADDSPTPRLSKATTRCRSRKRPGKPRQWWRLPVNPITKRSGAPSPSSS